MPTCNQLDLQTLRSQPIMPKNLRDHWSWVWEKSLFSSSCIGACFGSWVKILELSLYVSNCFQWFFRIYNRVCTWDPPFSLLVQTTLHFKSAYVTSLPFFPFRKQSKWIYVTKKRVRSSICYPLTRNDWVENQLQLWLHHTTTAYKL